MRSLYILGLILLLGGCSGPIGNMFAGVLGAGAMYGGQAALERGQEDVKAKILHRAERKKIVDAAIASKRRQCEDLNGSNLQYGCWKELLAFHDSQHPETLIMELRRRAKAPEPQMVEPRERLSFPSGFPEVLRERLGG